MSLCCGEKTERNVPNKGRRKLVTCLFSCCMFWFILCGILVTVLVFVGRHLLYNSGPTGQLYRYRPSSVNLPELHESSYKRLPNDTWPLFYNLTLLPFLDRNYFEGRVNISLKVSHPKKELVLHSKNLSISSVELVHTNKKVLNILTVTENLDDEVLVITPKEKVFPGEYFLTIKFRGNLEKKLKGFYKSSYKNGNKIRTIATSKFEPTYARQAFPCFDEPNMKAKYIVHLLKPKTENYIALSNYPVTKTETYDANNDLVTFNETVSMSTYLTCFIVSDFTNTETTFNNSGTQTSLKVYASPGNLEKTTYAGQVAKAIIEYYVNYFGTPYPLPKLDLVAIPDFVSGAMEHWGLVTFRETALLYTNMTHSSANKQRVATVVAHELAHSWFGNLVTMDWWNDLWLNEGFASYIEYKGVEAAEPSWQMMSQFQTADLHSVLSLDATLSSHPIVVTVTTPDEITSIFDTISYNKGSSILRMLENAVGETVFQKGVTNYLNKYAYGNAITKNFLDEIQGVVGATFDVSQMMDTFTVQMGYPVLNVIYDPISGNYVLTQKRFLKDPDATYDSNVTYKYRWTIPVTYITDLGKSTEQILFSHDQESITVRRPTGATWLKFNYDQVGYYRVNYQEIEWQNLINVYASLPVTDKTHLLEETFSLADATLLQFSVPLDLTRKLVSEYDYAPWSVASSKLQGILLFLGESTYSESFKNYVREIVSNAYSNLTWNEGSTDSHLTRLTRVVVLNLACAVDHAECLAQAEDKFNTWITVSTQPLSQDLRGIVYKYGMVNASEETWNKLLEVYLKENDATEKLKLINGLANIKNTTVLERLLEVAKNETVVRGQDYFSVLGYISSNPAGTDIVWDFIRNNWEYLVDRFTLNDRNLGTFLRTATNRFTTQAKLTEMEEFFAKYPEAGAGASARKTALETVQNNIDWLARHKTPVENWIQNLTIS